MQERADILLVAIVREMEAAQDGAGPFLSVVQSFCSCRGRNDPMATRRRGGKRGGRDGFLKVGASVMGCGPRMAIRNHVIRQRHVSEPLLNARHVRGGRTGATIAIAFLAHDGLQRR